MIPGCESSFYFFLTIAHEQLNRLSSDFGGLKTYWAKIMNLVVNLSLRCKLNYFQIAWWTEKKSFKSFFSNTCQTDWAQLFTTYSQWYLVVNLLFFLTTHKLLNILSSIFKIFSLWWHRLILSFSTTHFKNLIGLWQLFFIKVTYWPNHWQILKFLLDS